ncbi:pilus assembly FimT family protein [Acinetobacter indicus]|uniref:pilus assembly FimT family protein n=1 Tax=Acinetobacter indicus TaxID=756892 RepID=UPI000CECC7E4|nr:prepilin-type N-terminal cleavage/methylation domain-containing protein [Acinetobacter indicus]
MRKSQGFTLIELMVTIAVLAIIATMAAPSFTAMIERYKLKKNTEELVNVIKEARAKAILEVKDIILKFDSSAANTSGILNWKATAPVRLKNATQNEIKFSGKGIFQGTFNQIELCKKAGASESQIITIDKFGKIIKIEAGSCP